MKYHPECKCVFEHAIVDDTTQDWAEVCDALGQPARVMANETNSAKRNRAYWATVDAPVEWRE